VFLKTRPYPFNRYGFKCRYLSAHIRKDDSGNLTLVVDEDKKANAALNANEANYITPDIQKLLRTKKVRFSLL